MLKSHVTEISIRYRRKAKKQINLRSASEVYCALLPFFKEYVDHHEAMYALFMDSAAQLISIVKIGEGNLHGTVGNIKAIGQAAILQNAAGCILVHNHPSGRLSPSANDISITKSIIEMLKFTDTLLNDHLIISKNGFLSMKEEGLI